MSLSKDSPADGRAAREPERTTTDRRGSPAPTRRTASTRTPPHQAAVPDRLPRPLTSNDARNAWSEWALVRPEFRIPPHVLAELLDGGQAFRWIRSAPGAWRGVWSDCIAELRVDDDLLHWRAPAPAAARVGPRLAEYLAMNIDWAGAIDALPWRSDSHLAECRTSFPGLRILRQPFGETLLCFLCSATKQIVQIKQMVELLAARHGESIIPGPQGESVSKRLPTWDELAGIPEQSLRRCLLGFRARFISETSKFLAARPGWLAETESLPYPAAKSRLLELPGVGEKVADCVLLFGAGRLEAFPVDTWILRTLSGRYGLHGWKPAQLAQFGRSHFGPAAGLAQQLLFAWERANRQTGAGETTNGHQ